MEKDGRRGRERRGEERRRDEFIFKLAAL